ncbi:TIP-1 family-domain-containing protein [Pisolithus croceorrhizus]|nr:TIP-1 family-domain-containing protein [Pisolithus croceorrhizus]
MSLRYSVSTTLHQLQDPPSTSLAHKAAVEILNANFADAAHLEDLERVLQGTSARQATTKQQLLESEKALETFITKTRVEAITQLENARDLASQRDGIEDDLAYLSHCLVSSLSPTTEDNVATLLEDIEVMHRTLKELQNVRAYVAVVQRGLALSEAAVSQLRSRSSPLSAASVSGFATLQSFTTDVTRTCRSTEDLSSSRGSLHLLSFLQKLGEKTWADMKAILSATLVSAAESVNWPMAIDFTAASEEQRSKFQSAFLDLLHLQEIGQSLRSPKEDENLYPLQALVHPVALRFKYHFDGERETNRADKPEWYFTHIANVAHDHRPFMEGAVQRLLTGTKFQNVNAWHQYVKLLMGILERKIKRSVPQLLGRPALLAHTIYQSLLFDSSLRELGYEFDQVEGKKDEEVEKGGISRIILDEKGWFDAWIEGEKKFADDQYNEIISATDAWVIVDDHSTDAGGFTRLDEGDIKATNSARRVKALVEQVTDRYTPLPSFRQRTQFLIRVQVPVLENYHSRISSSLDAFETLSSAFVRAVPGALAVDTTKTDSKRLTGGVEGSQRLCKALLSARYVENVMRSWGEETFFLELWAEINRRAYLRARVGAHPSLPEPNGWSQNVQGAPEGTIFEELIMQYAKLGLRAEDMLIHQICGECETSLKGHFNSLARVACNALPTSLLDSAEGTAVNIMIPPTLLPSIALLSSHLTYLRSTLPSSTVTHLYRRIASRISEHVLQREVLFRPGLGRTSTGRHAFTRPQAYIIQAECELWVETCQVALNTSHARAEKPWSRLLAAGRLLAAEVQGHEQAFRMFSSERWWEADENEDVWEDALNDVTGLGTGGLRKDEVKIILRLRDINVPVTARR